MICKHGDFPIEIIQGNSYRRVYTFYDANDNILNDDLLQSVVLSVARLNYSQVLNWNEDEQGYVFLLSAETTDEFTYCKGTYDVTLTFKDTQVETEIYRSPLQIFKKNVVNPIVDNNGYMTCDNSKVTVRTGIQVIYTKGTEYHDELLHRDLPDQHPMSAITGLEEELDGKQPIGDYATTQEVDELANIVDGKADSDDIPTKVSDLTNDSNFATEDYVDNADTVLQGQIDDLQAEKMPLMDIDTTPTEGSTNLVESGGVYDAIDGVQQDVDSINDKIPAQASSSNQLADKNFVNSSVQTATANFRGNWNDWTEVPTDANLYPVDFAGSKTPTTNDYLVVSDASDYTLETLVGTWRFKYSGVWATDGKNGWHPEYLVNETPLTAAQLAALNSNITAQKVTDYDSHIANKSNPHEVTYQQLGGTKPTYTAQEVNALPISGGTMSGNINMGNNKITIVGNPTNDTDAANKQYVDAVADSILPEVTALDDGKILQVVDGVWSDSDVLTDYALKTDLEDYVAIEQGVAEAGKFLVVGNDGNVTTMALATWQGGSY